MEDETLWELRYKIGKERKYVNKKPYSHNIISCILRQIDKEYGREEANKAIRDYKLEKLGWSEMEVLNAQIT